MQPQRSLFFVIILAVLWTCKARSHIGQSRPLQQAGNAGGKSEAWEGLTPVGVVSFPPQFEVVYWASEFSQRVQTALRTCPYNSTVIGLGKGWPYNGVKLDLTLDYLRDQINPNKVVLFADGHDTLFQGGSTQTCPTATDYISLYNNQEADVIFQADGACGWASEADCGEYPQTVAKPYLNSGVILASVGALHRILEEHYAPMTAAGEHMEHDQAFWHIMYAKQQRQLREGKAVAPQIAVDYNETLAGSSLTHFVSDATQVRMVDGRLHYRVNDHERLLGCVVHTPGQSGNLIEKGLERKLLTSYQTVFLAPGRRISNFRSHYEELIV